MDIQHRNRGSARPLDTLFAEELGWVLEVESGHSKRVQDTFRDANVPCLYLGTTGPYGMEAQVIKRSKRYHKRCPELSSSGISDFL